MMQALQIRKPPLVAGAHQPRLLFPKLVGTNASILQGVAGARGSRLRALDHLSAGASSNGAEHQDDVFRRIRQQARRYQQALRPSATGKEASATTATAAGQQAPVQQPQQHADVGHVNGGLNGLGELGIQATDSMDGYPDFAEAPYHIGASSLSGDEEASTSYGSATGGSTGAYAYNKSNYEVGLQACHGQRMLACILVASRASAGSRALLQAIMQADGQRNQLIWGPRTIGDKREGTTGVLGRAAL